MSEHTSHADHEKRPYMTIFWLLLVLTVIEVSSLWLPDGMFPKALIAAFLLTLAVGKAALVAMYYMHLRYDPRLLWAIFLGPFGLAILFGVIIINQY
jgi:caa(3)-type oxidase subunit IV